VAGESQKEIKVLHIIEKKQKMNLPHLIFVFLMTLSVSFANSKGNGFWKKVEREVKRVQNQVENNPAKVLEDVLQFVQSPEETGTRVLKRVLKIKEENGNEEETNK
jgi:uncharacterized protein with NRDE domain